MPELDLIALLRKQDRESKEALDERVQEWANYLANWRGEFSNGDPQTLDEKAKLLEVLEADTGVKGVGYEDKVFVMETYRDIEAILIRECQAFVDISTPFKMKRPRIRIGQLQKTTKVDYEAATAYCVDLWKERCREEYVEVFRDKGIMGTGFTLTKEYDVEDGERPSAITERLLPWLCQCDPFHKHIPTARYFIYNRRTEIESAILAYPEKAAELRASVADDGDDNAIDTNPDKRQTQTVIIKEFYEKNPKILEGYLDEVELTELQGVFCVEVLANESGITDTILAIRKLNYPWIPVNAYTSLRAPQERGPWGIGDADLIKQDQEELNAVHNALLEAYGFATLQAYIIDNGLAPKLEGQLTRKRIQPGEIVPLELNGKRWKDVAEPFMFKDFTSQHMAVEQLARTAPQRTLGVTDMNSGISTQTYSDTLGEISELKAEGNIRFKFVANRLDQTYQKDLEMFVTITGQAVKDWTVRQEAEAVRQGLMEAPVIIYETDSGQDISLDPAHWDEDWEIKLLAGSAWVSNQTEAQQILQLAEIALKYGLPLPYLDMLQSVATKLGLDPAMFTPQQPQQVPGGPQAPALGGSPIGAEGLPPEPEGGSIDNAIPSQY